MTWGQIAVVMAIFLLGGMAIVVGIGAYESLMRTWSERHGVSSKKDGDQQDQGNQIDQK